MLELKVSLPFMLMQASAGTCPECVLLEDLSRSTIYLVLGISAIF